jgi:hypothetical protein
MLFVRPSCRACSASFLNSVRCVCPELPTILATTKRITAEIDHAFATRCSASLALAWMVNLI